MNKHNSFHEKIQPFLDGIQRKNPTLKRDELFLYWFLEAYILYGETSDTIRKSMIGGTGDKNLDAAFYDRTNKKLFLFQSKFRESSKCNEKSNDVKQFFQTCHLIQYGLKDFLKGVKNQAVKSRLLDCGILSNIDDFQVVGVYATTGKISESIQKDTRDEYHDIQTLLMDAPRIDGLFYDFIDGVAPPVPFIRLSVHDGKYSQIPGKRGTNVSTYFLY